MGLQLELHTGFCSSRVFQLIINHHIRSLSNPRPFPLITGKPQPPVLDPARSTKERPRTPETAAIASQNTRCYKKMTRMTGRRSMSGTKPAAEGNLYKKKRHLKPVNILAKSNQGLAVSLQLKLPAACSLPLPPRFMDTDQQVLCTEEAGSPDLSTKCMEGCGRTRKDGVFQHKILLRVCRRGGRDFLAQRCRERRQRQRLMCGVLMQRLLSGAAPLWLGFHSSSTPVLHSQAAHTQSINKRLEEMCYNHASINKEGK